MTSRLKVISLKGFPGGLYSINKGYGALPHQLLKATNVVIGNSGEVKKRPPHNLLPGMYRSNYSITGICYPYITSNKQIIEVAHATILHTYTTGGRGDFLHVEDKYVHSNGVDKMQVWTTADSSSSDVAGNPPLSRLLHRHNNRCFAVSGNTLYETEVNTYPDKTTDNFANGASWEIGDNSTNITGLASIDRDLFIFKEDSVYIQTGYTVNERQTFLFSKHRGCIAPGSIKSVHMKNMGDGIIFLSETKELWFLQRSGMVQIGECIQNTLDDSIVKTSMVGADDVGLAKLQYLAYAGVVRNKYYLLGMESQGGGAPYDYKKCLCVHLNNNLIETQFGLRPAMTLFENTGYSYNGISSSPQTWRVFGNNNWDKLTVVSAFPDLNQTSGSSSMVSEIRSDDVGYATDDLLAQDGSNWQYAICDTIQTAYLDAGIQYQLKNWVDAIMYIARGEWSNGLSQIAFTQRYGNNEINPTNDNNILPFNVPATEYVVDCPFALGNDYAKISLEFSSYKAPFYQGPNPIDLRIFGIDIFFGDSSRRVSDNTIFK